MNHQEIADKSNYQQNINWFIINISLKQNEDGYTNVLVHEVIENGFKYNLCVVCNIGYDCKHSKLSLLPIIGCKTKSYWT